MEENFSHIQLPNFVLANWFKHHLIEEEATSTITKTSNNNTSISFLGNNKKNIVLIVNELEGVFISDNNLTLIEKLLSACKLTLADVAVLNIAKTKINYKDFKQQLQPQVLILMGIDPTSIQLPLVFPMHKIQAYDSCKMLITTSIDRMQKTNDPKVLEEKKELWGLLKTLFNL